jgi:putative membrane protein
VLLLLALSFAAASSAKSASLKPVPFVKEVAQINLLEIALGKVAQKNSTNAEVKQFGFYMVKSHTQINSMLRTSAAQQGIPVPKALNDSSKATLQKLSALKGKAFDTTYIPAMVQGHTQVLAMLKKFARTTSDPVLKKFAQKITPIIAMHLHHAEMVQDDLRKDGEL